MARKVVLVLVLSLFANRAFADDREQAQRHYSAGMAHYNLREYKEAIKDFEASYRLAPDPVFLFNLGQCHRLLKRDRDALYFYQAYLRARPDAENRVEVEKRIDALKKAVAALPPEPPPPPEPKPSPDTPATHAASGPTAASLTAAPPPRRTPLYKKWWLWTTVVVVAGAGVGLGVGLGTRGGEPRSYPLVNF
jgi:tetratricopeptide (TPR) repeat protein